MLGQRLEDGLLGCHQDKTAHKDCQEKAPAHDD
jgi:hypothetical protein